MSNTIKIIDRGMKRILKDTKKLHNAYTKVGYPLNINGDLSEIAQIASYQEYGTKRGIPPRPFMRNSFDLNLDRIKSVRDKVYNDIISNKITPKRGLQTIGTWFTGVTKRTIDTGNFKRLSDRTIKKKKSEKPLIDTAQMRNSVTHEENI